MIQHHVSDDLLLEYAAGGLDEGSSLLVATHVALCTQCRRFVADAEVLGGMLLEDAAPEPLRDHAAATVLDRKSTRLNSSHVKRSRMPSSA